MVQIGFELTDEQAYALAELIDHLNADNVRPHAQDAQEGQLMCTALTDLQLALEHAGFYPRPVAG